MDRPDWRFPDVAVVDGFSQIRVAVLSSDMRPPNRKGVDRGAGHIRCRRWERSGGLPLSFGGRPSAKLFNAHRLAACHEFHLSWGSAAKGSRRLLKNPAFRGGRNGLGRAAAGGNAGVLGRIQGGIPPDCEGSARPGRSDPSRYEPGSRNFGSSPLVVPFRRWRSPRFRCCGSIRGRGVVAGSARRPGGAASGRSCGRRGTGPVGCRG